MDPTDCLQKKNRNEGTRFCGFGAGQVANNMGACEVGSPLVPSSLVAINLSY